MQEQACVLHQQYIVMVPFGRHYIGFEYLNWNIFTVQGTVLLKDLRKTYAHIELEYNIKPLNYIH